MIVCQCNIVTVQDIEETITGLLDEDLWRLIVPVQVYHAMGKRGRCCGCFPVVVEIIVRTTEAYHQRIATPQAEVICFLGRLHAEQRRHEEDRANACARVSGAIAA